MNIRSGLYCASTCHFLVHCSCLVLFPGKSSALFSWFCEYHWQWLLINQRRNKNSLSYGLQTLANGSWCFQFTIMHSAWEVNMVNWWMIICDPYICSSAIYNSAGHPYGRVDYVVEERYSMIQCLLSSGMIDVYHHDRKRNLCIHSGISNRKGIQISNGKQCTLIFFRCIETALLWISITHDDPNLKILRLTLIRNWSKTLN